MKQALLVLGVVLGLCGAVQAGEYDSGNDWDIWNQGFEDGYRSGPGIDPIAPATGIPPMRKIGETNSDYYLRGAQEGMLDRQRGPVYCSFCE